MLEPQSRRLLLESLSPPSGMKLDWAVGTTYSLDLIALLAAPVAFAFSDWQDREGKPVLEPLALLKATRQYADKMLLFCQAGKIHVPHNYQPLLANLESSIAQASAPKGGSFHPKVWLLRYFNEVGDVTYRLLCLSRNLTFDRSWDTMLSLEGPLLNRVNAIARNHPLGQFVEALPKMVHRELSATWQQRLEQLAYDIRRVDFEVPEPFSELLFHPLGISEKSNWPFPEKISQMLVISPFIDAGFATKLSAYKSPLELVSRPECMARMSSAELAPYEKLWILDETAEPESADEVKTEPNSVDQPANAELPAEEVATVSPLVGLHAKAYVADIGWAGHLWTGSANATMAAFTKNVEFLVELQGKKSRCGVAATLGRSEEPAEPGEKSKPHVATLADLLQAYTPDATKSESEKEQELFDRLAEAVAKQIAARAPVARCEPLASENEFAVAIYPTVAGDVHIPTDYQLKVRPISFVSSPGIEAKLLDETWCRFERVSLLGLTSFFVWELISADARFSHAFVLHVPLENPPTNRHEHLLRMLLSDRDRVLKFLLMLLADSQAGDFGQMAEMLAGMEPRGASLHELLDSTLMESLLRALDRQPEQIDQVAQIIHDLEKNAEGKQLLPDNLAEIWDPIWEVRCQQRKHVMAP